MPGASWRLLLTAAVVFARVESLKAQSNEATSAEQEFAALETRYAPTSQDSPQTPSHAVQQVAYLNTSNAQPAILPAPPAPTPATAGPTVIPPGSPSSIYPSPEGSTELIVPPQSDSWCVVPPQPPPQPRGCRTSSWTAAVEIIPSQTMLTDGQFGRWNDNDAFALRLVLGYEDPDGIGIRARVWGLGQDVSAPADDVELSMGSFNLDLYKRVFLDRTEIAFGGGPASGALEFKLSDDTHSRFAGGGVSMFLDGRYDLVEFEKSELAAIARARYSLLMGDWRDTTGNVVPRTDNDTMSVAELAWGLEYRRRFGACEDHDWFVGILSEFQRWQSDWMSNFSGSSVGISGLNIYTGIDW